jgi:hypothetical protein
MFFKLKKLLSQINFNIQNKFRQLQITFISQNPPKNIQHGSINTSEKLANRVASAQFFLDFLQPIFPIKAFTVSIDAFAREHFILAKSQSDLYKKNRTEL